MRIETLLRHGRMPMFGLLAALCLARVAVAQSPPAANRVAVQTVYQHVAIEGFHRLALIGELHGKGTLFLDPNVCAVNEWGDATVCTQIAPTERPVTIRQVKEADPANLNRRRFDVAGGLSNPLQLIVPDSPRQPTRLVYTDRGPSTPRTITTEPLVWLDGANDSDDASRAAGTVEPCAARYRAEQVPGEVILYATGQHTTGGYRVFFQELSLPVFPPQWRLLHVRPTGVVTQAITPFHVCTAFAASEKVERIVVFDAAGQREVAVEQVPDSARPTSATTADAAEQFAVRAAAPPALDDVIAAVPATAAPLEAAAGYANVMESYPEEIQARLEARDRFFASLGAVDGIHVDAVIAGDLQRWKPGQTVRVAFRGGDAALCQDVAAVAREWTQYANLQLDCGPDPAAGRLRSWSPDDAQYVAEIRVSFDQPGYWSLVGNDSVNRAIVGPGAASLNLSGFHVSLPPDWRATVLHEFGHALGFQHEHQHPLGGCDNDFRWSDDAGYVPTKNARGAYVNDVQNRRPGIYSVLAGWPNFWSRAKVDHNLRQLPDSDAYVLTPFDPRSIMKYYFAGWMFTGGTQSHCFSEQNLVLSPGDVAGAKLVYPHEPDSISKLVFRRAGVLEAIGKSRRLPADAQGHVELQLQALRQ